MRWLQVIRMIVISSRERRQPPVWALLAHGGQGKPPRVCSGRTSWTPATARRARPPLASTHHRSAPAEGVLQSQKQLQRVLIKHLEDQSAQHMFFKDPALANWTLAVGARNRKQNTWGGGSTSTVSWEGAGLATSAAQSCASRLHCVNGKAASLTILSEAILKMLA